MAGRVAAVVGEVATRAFWLEKWPKSWPAMKIHTPKLAHPEDAADFVMEVREAGNAGV